MILPLKEYQEKTLATLEDWLAALLEEKIYEAEEAEARVKRGRPPAPAKWPELAWETMKHRGALDTNAAWIDRRDGRGAPIPNVCLKIPTGGGKTLLGVHAVDAINRHLLRLDDAGISPEPESQAALARKTYNRQNRLVVWIVPSDAIYAQTRKNFTDPDHPYRAILKRAAGGRSVKILERNDPFTPNTLSGNFCVMLLMLQASNRESKAQLRMFRNSGGFTDFAPDMENRLKHQAYLREIPNLEAQGEETPGGEETELPLVKSSLANVLRMVKPVFVIDEGHKAYSAGARKTIEGFNPSFILELSATPTAKVSNILVDIAGQTLKNEEMIKLPVKLDNNPQSKWKETLRRAVEKRNELETLARKAGGDTGRYVRPILLVQVERTGKEQRGADYIHSEDVRDALRKMNLRDDAVRVKSAELDEINKLDLLSPECPVRAIITKQALQEGWDCSFAYVLALLSRTTAPRALTQLTGRILRQPGAQLFGGEYAALDQSYVFCHEDEVEQAARKIKTGLEQEGLGDAGYEIDTGGESGSFKEILIQRRKQFRNTEVDLPLVLHKTSGNQWRKLDYHTDILGVLPWEEISCSAQDLLSAEASDRFTQGQATIDIDGEVYASEETAADAPADPAFFARALCDLTLNPWRAAAIAGNALDKIRESMKGQPKKSVERRINANRNQICDRMIRCLEEKIEAASEVLFRKKIKDGQISCHLETRAGEELFWRAPKKYTIYTQEESSTLTRDGNPVQLTLFEPAFRADFNELERKVALYLDTHKALEWWHRIVARADYGLQGWRKHRVYPDFLVSITKRKSYALLETKGMHLSGNDDTQYKEKLFCLLEQHFAHRLIPAGKVVAKGKEGKSIIFRMLFSDRWEEELDALLAEKSPAK